ncbi:MAG: ribbon-helix-helix protein, CopG family [Candidatus Aenigmarchaeota archaeon]|nr:ribbon-helix-helix protein, CopG family [Candidatus Aenigmarchaeota archaeon]
MTRRTTKTITISLSPELANKIDRLAKAENKTKSQLFRDMFAVYEEYIAEKEWQEIFRYGKETAKRLGITSEEDVYRIINEVRSLEKEK